MTQQKQYDKEFKLNTVQLVLASGKPITQIARELGISSNHYMVGWRSIRTTRNMLSLAVGT